MHVPAGFVALAAPLLEQRRQTATLTRTETGDHGTFGTLVAGAFRSCTIEPPWRGNLRRLSCIPAGEYRCVPHRSPRFGRCYYVTDVPNRSHVLFHGGNFGGNSELGFKTHSLGCILQGKRTGWLPYNGRPQKAVLISKPTVRAFFEAMGWRPFTLTIRGIG